MLREVHFFLALPPSHPLFLRWQSNDTLNPPSVPAPLSPSLPRQSWSSNGCKLGQKPFFDPALWMSSPS